LQKKNCFSPFKNENLFFLKKDFPLFFLEIFFEGHFFFEIFLGENTGYRLWEKKTFFTKNNFLQKNCQKKSDPKKTNISGKQGKNLFLIKQVLVKGEKQFCLQKQNYYVKKKMSARLTVFQNGHFQFFP
jgi:hypothetical protein